MPIHGYLSFLWSKAQSPSGQHGEYDLVYLSHVLECDVLIGPCGRPDLQNQASSMSRDFVISEGGFGVVLPEGVEDGAIL